MKYKGVIDLGSLKAKMLIFDKAKMSLVAQESHLTLLGKEIDRDNNIIYEALQKLDEALNHIKNKLNKYRCDDVSIIATDSLRLAKNTNDVLSIVDKYFPKQTVTILDQDSEGDLFFKVVSRSFSGVPLVAIDIGGGSVQIFSGEYDIENDIPIVKNKYLQGTGTYKLQQKYSPNNSVISTEFDKAISEVKERYTHVNIKSDIVVFGSTCMQDFLKESGIRVYYDKSFPGHDFYVTKIELEQLLDELRKFPPDQRANFYPTGGYFIYGADYLLINLIEIIDRTDAQYIYPTNLNSSYGLPYQMI